MVSPRDIPERAGVSLHPWCRFGHVLGDHAPGLFSDSFSGRPSDTGSDATATQGLLPEAWCMVFFVSLVSLVAKRVPGSSAFSASLR